MLIREVMTKGAECVEPGASVEDAARRMKRHNVGMLPVVEDHRLVGVVTDRDIVVRAVAKGACLETTKVGEIMTRKPAVCRDDDDFRDVSRLMEARKVRRLPVMNSREKLVGVFSLDDFGKRFAAQDVAGEVLEAVAARRA